MSARKNMDATGWRDREFIRTFTPTTRILIIGNSIEAASTASLAQAAGYDAIAVQGGDQQSVASLLDSWTAVAFLQHGDPTEINVLSVVLASDVFYIGALGSKRTHQQRVAALLQSGVTQDQVSRIKAPIGIFDKARTSTAIALSVLADVAACPV
jgi:xanthine dehydrogenase accessory factor